MHYCSFNAYYLSHPGPILKDAGVRQVLALDNLSLAGRLIQHSTNPQQCVRCLKHEQEPALQVEEIKPVKVGLGQEDLTKEEPTWMMGLAPLEKGNLPNI